MYRFGLYDYIHDFYQAQYFISQMNLVVIPYHDWRKIMQEGARTRDAHFIEEFRENKNIEKLIIINRPITIAEVLLKGKPLNIKGRLILKENGARLISVDDKTFIIDVFIAQDIRHLLQRRKWYFEAYQNKRVVSFVLRCLEKLNVKNNYNLLSQNILAGNLFDHLKPKKLFFDAWDNFRLMSGLDEIYTLLGQSYLRYGNNAHLWYTNSLENIAFYKDNYQVKSISLMKNGVDYDRFTKVYDRPKDLMTLKKPIVGFGGKITHLFDHKLFNYLVRNNPDFDFIIVGQILDQSIFKSIEKHLNFHFFGDKHYNEYPAYVTNFDVGIVPYVTGEKQHGGDSIKAYEYLAAGKKVVGTRGSGLQNLSEYLFVADSPEEFSKFLKMRNNKKQFNGEEHSWSSKAKKIIQDFNDL